MSNTSKMEIKMFKITLKSYGNVDRGQYFEDGVLSTTEKHSAATIEELQVKARAYIEANYLGAGNWKPAKVKDASGKVVGVIHYNGKFQPL